MTGIVGYAIHQIVHLVFDIRTKYKHERTININETCPWSPGGLGLLYDLHKMFILAHIIKKIGLGCLTPLSTMIQLYSGFQFYWKRNPEYRRKPPTCCHK
jgi:hypothetical protein